MGLKAVAGRDGQTYNNPTVTGSVSGGLFVLAQSFAAVDGPADANENIVATVTVPAGVMGANGLLEIVSIWDGTSSTNIKSYRIRFGGIGGTAYFSTNTTTSSYVYDHRIIANAGATNSQAGGQAGLNQAASFGTMNADPLTSAVDTTAAVSLVFTVQKETAGETATLRGYSVRLLKP